tara:strand:- start:1442 stop:1738 length:297 start_codon:yes stop_codon:yes gene_type:complete
MDEPLVGTREQNYRFFYVASGAAVSSLVILLVITGYTAYISTMAGNLIVDMNEVIGDFQIIIPDIKSSLKLLETICDHENFTKAYGDICYTSIAPSMN